MRLRIGRVDSRHYSNALGYDQLEKLSRGKFFRIELRKNTKNPDEVINKISDEILSNPIVEKFKIEKE